MLGYGDEDMRESPDWRNLVHPDDMTRVQTAIRDHVAGKLPIFESMHRMRHRNGEWRWVISRAQARVDNHGRLLRLVGVELDITERKLYEEALFREKESAQITLQSIGDGVITTDADSTIDYINPVAEELTGWRLEDAMGRPGGGDLPRLPRGDLRAAGESAVGGDPPHPPHQVGAADAAHPPRRQRAVRREHRGPDPRRRRPRGRRRAGVPRRERVARAEPPPVLPRQPRPADRAGQPPRVREPPGAGAEERQGARGLLRAVLPRHRPVQDRQRQLRSRRRRCAAGPGRRAAEVQGALARHAVAPGRRRVRHPAGELLAR